MAVQFERLGHFAEKVVVVSGHPGCGKTMLSPIISSLDRVELLTYAYELEYVCQMNTLENLEDSAAISFVKIVTDLQLYNTMMSREINFRPSDLSSALRDIHPLRYIQRLFLKGDEYVPERITKTRPILNLTVHNLLPFAKPLFLGLEERLVFVEVVRHPLYMVKQHALNMSNVVNTPRSFSLYYQHKGQSVPYWANMWEDLYVESNDIEKAVYSIVHYMRNMQKQYALFQKQYGNIVIIPFETFVMDPMTYMDQLTMAIDSGMTQATYRMMRKQNVPRTMYAQGVNLPIYRRCGWEPPKSVDEIEEFKLRRQYVQEHVSSECLSALDLLCEQYEEQYLGGKKGYVN